MYDIDKKRILLYGYSQFDLVFDKYEKLISAGYDVVGFLDRNAVDLRRTQKVPIWTLDEMTFSPKEKKNIVVIVLLQNGQLHPVIADELYANGFQKILYLPCEIGTAEQKMMYELYNFFLEEQFILLRNIPDYGEIKNGITVERRTNNTDSIYVTRLVPMTDVYSYRWHGQIETRIDRQELYYELYDFLTGKREDCSNYLKFCGITDDRKERFLQDRRRLYDRFELERKAQTEYFNFAAPHAEWNSEGHFNIVDGHHRAAYLAYCKEKKLYLRIRKTDDYKWRRFDGLVKMEENENGRNSN